MPIQHKKEYGVYLWDTFDNETILLDEFDFEDDAKDYIDERFGEQISPHGADRVEIVDSEGNVTEWFSIT